MEVLKSKEDFTSVKLGLSERELFLLDVQHKISSRDVLHDEVDTSLRLETRVETEEERVSFLRSGEEDSLFRLGAERKLTPEEFENELTFLLRRSR